jgi:formyltetrahydrofolate deformylase
MENTKKFILKISCPDQKGLIAATTNVLHMSGANILDLNQHTATDIDRFFLRTIFEVPTNMNLDIIRGHIQALAVQFNMDWEVYSGEHKDKVAILVSKYDHCLYDLLLEHKDGQLPCEFECIISNHSTLEPIAQTANLPYYTITNPKDKEQSEAEINSILSKHQCTTVVLARYMQILSNAFCTKWDQHIINIHHGFLPAFQGAKPYHQAWKKGVKLIGATAHFATAELDQGPIIWQNVIHVSDNCSVQDFVQKGKDVERRTLTHALKLYLERRVFPFQNRTFIL